VWDEDVEQPVAAIGLLGDELLAIPGDVEHTTTAASVNRDLD
jgi:hypothetical protein